MHTCPLCLPRSMVLGWYKRGHFPLRFRSSSYQQSSLHPPSHPAEHVKHPPTPLQQHTTTRHGHQRFFNGLLQEHEVQQRSY